MDAFEGMDTNAVAAIFAYKRGAGHERPEVYRFDLSPNQNLYYFFVSFIYNENRKDKEIEEIEIKVSHKLNF